MYISENIAEYKKEKAKGKRQKAKLVSNRYCKLDIHHRQASGDLWKAIRTGIPTEMSGYKKKNQL